MLKNIDKNNDIFKSDAYRKDIVPFQLLELIKENPILLVSDEKDFIIGASHPDMPVWVWTSDEIDKETKPELAWYFYEYFEKYRQKLSFVAKPETASVLAEPFINNKNAKISVVNMQSYKNEKVIPPKNKEAVIEAPTEKDVLSIANLLRNFSLECFGSAADNIEEYVNTAQKLLNDRYCRIIKENGNVVAMARSSRENQEFVAINGVYTLPEHRKKGYASAIVAHISNLILQNGKIPALYTDLSNPSSNTAYKNIGFIEQAPIDQIYLNWSEQK